MSNSVVDLEAQLRQAEARRAELERQYAEALSNLRSTVSVDPFEARQSRVRELEKKVALETVRVEELQLELAAARRAASTVPMTTNSTTTSTSWGVQGSEIERIMAKIEQDNRILAELEHSRSTTLSAPECQWGMSAPVASSLDMGAGVIVGTSAVSAPVSPLPGSCLGNVQSTACSIAAPPIGFQYGATTSSINHPGIYSQPPFSSSTACSTLAHQLQSGLLQGQTNTSFSTGTTMVTLPNQVSAYTNPTGVTSYCNPISLASQTPYSNVTVSGALSNQQQTVFSNHTSSYANTMSLASQLPFNTNTSVLANHTSYSNPLVSTLPGTLGYTSLANPTSVFNNNVSFSNPLSATQWCPPAMSVKLKPLEEIELGRRIPTPVTPHAPNLWDRPLSRPTIPSGPSDCTGDWGVPDGQVDMLDIPGKGRCSVYIARFSYEPEPDAPEDELPVVAGDYLLVWGEPGAAYLDAETLDGRRGLVPAHFAQRLVGDDLLEFHQAVLSSLRDEETALLSAEMLAADVQRLCEIGDPHDEQEDESIEGQVGAPRQLTLERQLNKSVLISWTAPEPSQPGGNHVESYHVYVDGVLKTTVKASERTRALVEGVDSNRPHRISVRSVTANRRTSRDAACTMVIGRDTQILGPTAVRATHVTSSSAIISWLPANSNHQHVVCVNNVEVRTVKPGVYRHTITGLTPNTQYRVTVRAKHTRAQPILPGEEPPCPAAAHTDFRTLPKGLPDPPADIMVEAGPQDGTLLVTWHPVQAPHHPGSVVTGYAVYADGKKVTDVDSPTGDHALIDISKLLGLNPKHVTVRTKARDSQSADSVPTPIPPAVLRGGISRQRQPHTGLPPHVRPQRGPGGPQQQVIIEHEDNLSDKEIFPSGQPHHRQQGPGIPQIEITKDSASEAPLSEDDYVDGRRGVRGHHQGQMQQGQPVQHYQQPGRMQQQGRAAPHQRHGVPPQQPQQPQQYYTQPGVQAPDHRGLGGQQRRGGPQQGQQIRPADQGQPPSAPKKARWFVALFDYDPTTMSPNPDACDEELPFNEGDHIKVWGDKDADGFYWGECRGRRGFVPHNMVMEVEGSGPRAADRDRWGDIYANMPVKRMVALYDYDPQELSPNVDAEQVELSFTTGSIIHVYGEMDDDGFYMGELDGVRGLVPSNFLTEAPDQYGAGGTPGGGGAGGPGRGQRGVAGGGGGPGVAGSASTSSGAPRGHGPGARGPPPPPRDAASTAAGSAPRPQRGGAASAAKTDACPVVPCSQLDHHTTNHTNATVPPNTQASATEQQQAAMRNQQRGVQRGNPAGSQPQQSAYNQQQQYQQPLQNQYQQPGSYPQQQQQQPYHQQGPFQASADMQGQRPPASMHKGAPQVLPTVTQPIQQQQQNPTNAPNALMQKLNEMTAPGGDILSKGKELIFMKFGLGGK